MLRGGIRKNLCLAFLTARHTNNPSDAQTAALTSGKQQENEYSVMRDDR